MKTASRTLVKSPPEVWEQLDQPARMEGLMCALVGHATEVEVYERVAESKLAWKAGSEARIEIKLAEKGWGTNVRVSAENDQEPTKLEGWLDAVLDELATPTKRPFEGMTEQPAGTVIDAMVAKPAQAAPVEEPLVKPPEDVPVEPVKETAAAENPAEASDEPVEEAAAAEAPAELPLPPVGAAKPETPAIEPRPAETPQPARPGFLRRLFGR